MIIGNGVQFGNGVIITNYNIPTYIWTWGANQTGQLGNGTTTNSSSPDTVAGAGTMWNSVAAGRFTVLAVKTDGTLWSWGTNDKGQLGNGTNTNPRSSPVTVAGGGTTWASVSSNYDYSAAIKTDGTLWTCGYNNQGQLGDGTTSDRSSFATVAGGGTTWSQVCTAHQGAHLAAVKTDGTLWTCGHNNSGQLGDGTTTNRSSFVQIAGGGTTWQSVGIGGRGLAAIKTDGTLWTCGYNGYGNLGYSGGGARSSPGTVAGGGTTWSQVAVGLYHAVAVKTDGTLWSCGYNIYGQLGDGTTTTRNTGFVQVAGTLWKQAAVSTWSSAAVKTDGTVWAWGSGASGKLGNGSSVNRSSPTKVAGTNNNWQQVAVGTDAMAAIG